MGFHGPAMTYASAQELNDRLIADISNRPLAGIIFDNIDVNSADLPQDLRFSLRFPAELQSIIPGSPGDTPLTSNWQTDLLVPLFQDGGPRNRQSGIGGTPPGYYEERFLALQSAISLAFIRHKQTVETTLPELILQRFYYPPTTVDFLLEILRIFVPLIFFLSFLYPSINNVKVGISQKTIL